MEIKPQAMAMPRDTDKLEKGKYGPVFPKSPACYGFTIIPKIIPGREPIFYQYAQNIEKAVADQPNCLAPLMLHYLRWVLFPINGETYFMYQGIFDTDFDKYTEDGRYSPTLESRQCLRTWRGFHWIGRPMLPHSSSLSGIISVRAFWNTGNIRLSVRTRSRRR